MTSAVYYTNAAAASLEQRKSRGTPLELLGDTLTGKESENQAQAGNSFSNKLTTEKMANIQVDSMPKGKRSSFKLKPVSSKVVVTQSGTGRPAITKEKLVEESYHLIDFDASAITPLSFNACGSTSNEPIFHILVLGSLGSGVTSLAARFVGERIDDGYGMRVVKHGDHFVPVSIQVAHSANELNGKSLKKACGAVIVCDSTSAVSSVRGACQWKKELDTARKVLGLPRLHCVLAASKFDAASKVRTADKQVEEMAANEGVLFDSVYSASALTGLNVDNAFNSVIEATACKVPNFASAPEMVKIQPLTISVEGNPTSSGGEGGKCVIS